jgi:hypothetical protein
MMIALFAWVMTLAAPSVARADYYFNVHWLYVSLLHLPDEGCEFLRGHQGFGYSFTLRCHDRGPWKPRASIGLYHDKNLQWPACRISPGDPWGTGTDCYSGPRNQNTWEVFPHGYTFPN